MIVYPECSSGLQSGSNFLMTMRSGPSLVHNQRSTIVVVSIMIILSLSPLMINNQEKTNLSTSMKYTEESRTAGVEPWNGTDQPWPQSGKNPERMSVAPPHSPSGGAGMASPSDASELYSIVDPTVNWVYGSYSLSTDSLSTPIADLSNQITTEPDAEERCGGSSLFAIIVQTVVVGGSDHSILRIIEGEDADLAWEVDLGSTEMVKASPLVVDMNDDGVQEILVVYDAAGTLHVDAWSPQLQCSVTGWSASGSHSSELLWTFTDETLRISINGPYTAIDGHKPTAQPLLADLDLDGDAELVIAAIHEVSEDIVVIALPLGVNGEPTPIWQSTLQDGTHPSDPAFAIVDENTGYVVLTTTEASNGAMWVWKLDSDNGDQKWDGLLLPNNLGGTDSDVPHIRLPGPIVAELDSSTSGPEIVVTIPADPDGSSDVLGAQFRGLNLDDGNELWSFEAVNGYADAPPVLIDSDNDGTQDRACWVTWHQTTFDRHGQAGCHDLSTTTPQLEWYHDLERTSGNLNDEIAVSQPIWMNIDGDGIPELLVAYGRTLWAWDGDSGTQVAINSEWAAELELNHRVWSSPAMADIDGDATLDIIIGDTVVSTKLADLRPLIDGRSIEFNPSSPNPNEEVTITAFFENAGTAEIDRSADAILFADGDEIARHRVESLVPADPTGNGGFESFSVEWSGDLGEHIFELILDPNHNVTQSRYDNDQQTVSLDIVLPYNATFEIPSEPTRVDPGSFSVANPTIRSTGRLAGIWSLSVDATNLPDSWSWSDETIGGISGIEIGVGETWNPSLRINAPSSAPGSDAGHLELTLTLDDDENISVTADLPIEANRTRGLSIRGPSGTSTSTGYGLIGDSAKAWLIVENLGNADENSISLDWTVTSWEESTEEYMGLYNQNDVEIPALSLLAGESKIISARIEVPSNDVNLGDSVSTSLTMCIGIGDDETCQSVELVFVASGVVAETIHQRSMPDNALSWTITADLPNSSPSVEWSIINAGMGIDDWIWSTSGDLSLNSGNLTIQGSSGTRVSGMLTLQLPDDAPPAFHSFSDQSSVSNDFSLHLSIEVLQIYRASMTLISPTVSPHIIDVETATAATVRLLNPGNGMDTYSMSYSLILDSNLSEDPGVELIFSNSEITLGAGNLRTLPVQVILPENTPARIPINIEIVMRSSGDNDVFSLVILTLEARQDHRWEFTSEISGVSAEGNSFAVIPSQTLDLNIIAKNIGNLQDSLVIYGTGISTNVEGDSSSGWDISSSNVTEVEVNETITISISITPPPLAWNGSIIEVTMIGVSFDETVYNMSFIIEIAHVAGWTAMANNANLEINPEGASVTLIVEQNGNSPTRPYASVYVTGESGWSIETPEQLPILNPGDSTPLSLQITPPPTARHGNTVELHIKLREGDGSAESIITLPLRVAIIHNFTLTGSGNWILSEHGGFPVAELQNLGNAPTTISLQVLSLPPGWNVSGRTEVVLGINEITGIPIEIIPADDWDGSKRTIRILAQDSIGSQQEISLETEKKDHSWASSPVIVAMDGDNKLLKIHGTSLSSQVSDEVQNNLLWDLQGGWVWQASASAVGNQLTIDSTTNLLYSAHIIEPASRTASCSIYGEITAIYSECSVGNGSTSFQYTIMLTDDEGVMIDSIEDIIPANTTLQSTNLSSFVWNPEPGYRTLSIKLLDNRGVLIASDEKTFEIRRTDWNVGLVGIELQGEGASQEIKILTIRENQHLLSDADCKIQINAGDYNAEHTIDMTGVYSPTPKFDRPDIEDGTEMIVTIYCSFPWDIDSDSSDDEVRKILSGGSISTTNGFEWGTGVGFAIMMIAIALAVTWVIRNHRERGEILRMTESVMKRRVASKKVAEEPLPQISETLPTISAEDTTQQTTTGDTIEQKSTEIIEEELDEFESRLKRLSGLE